MAYEIDARLDTRRRNQESHGDLAWCGGNGMAHNLRRKSVSRLAEVQLAGKDRNITKLGKRHQPASYASLFLPCAMHFAPLAP